MKVLEDVNLDNIYYLSCSFLFFRMDTSAYIFYRVGKQWGSRNHIYLGILNSILNYKNFPAL